MTASMHFPTWDELRQVQEQMDVLEHPLNADLFVVGPPGSGKTILAVRRALMVLASVIDLVDGTYRRPTAALVTFNRMLRRLAALYSENGSNEHTMHSFVAKDYPPRANKPVLSSPRNPYDYQWRNMLAQLSGSGLIDRWDHLVIDEGQDLPEDFFRYAKGNAATAISVFADDEQAITTRRTTIAQIREAAGLPAPKLLSENHRNVAEVAAVARHFHVGRLPITTVRRGSIAEKPRLLRLPSLDAVVAQLTVWSQTRGGSVGVIVDSNNTGEAVYQRLRGAMPSARVDFYTHERKNEDAINVLQPGLTIVNVRSVKGQEFHAVFILELERFLPCRDETAKRIMYMLCARARDHLFLVSWRSLGDDALASLPHPDMLERE